MPAADTPGVIHPDPGGLPRAAAETAWRSVTPLIAGTPHVRVSRDGGRTYPARHARPLPAESAAAAVTVPVYDPGPATGRMLALDLDLSRVRTDPADDTALVSAPAEVERQAAELGQLLERLGGRHVADVSPSGGRHVYVLFAAPLPWLELRDLARAVCAALSRGRPGADGGLGGQISPPGARHKSGGWRLLSGPPEDAAAAAGHPNGPGGLGRAADGVRRRAAPPRAGCARGAPIRRPAAELDDAGVPWVPRLGGRAPLGAELEHVARTGRWDQYALRGPQSRRAWRSWALRWPGAGSWPTSGPR